MAAELLAHQLNEEPPSALHALTFWAQERGESPDETLLQRTRAAVPREPPPVFRALLADVADVAARLEAARDTARDISSRLPPEFAPQLLEDLRLEVLHWPSLGLQSLLGGSQGFFGAFESSRGLLGFVRVPSQWYTLCNTILALALIS